MPAPMSSVVRPILSANINLSADEVIKLARDKGVKAPEKSIRDSIYNIRSELKSKGAKPAPAPAAARTTAPAAKSVPAAVSSSPAANLGAVLSNVALVNTVVGVSGGVEQARQVAEAVRACGSVEAFLQHLEVVAQVRGASA
jgi:hypothetical protein